MRQNFAGYCIRVLNLSNHGLGNTANFLFGSASLSWQVWVQQVAFRMQLGCLGTFVGGNELWIRAADSSFSLGPKDFPRCASEASYQCSLVFLSFQYVPRLQYSKLHFTEDLIESYLITYNFCKVLLDLSFKRWTQEDSRSPRSKNVSATIYFRTRKIRWWNTTVSS